MAVVELFKQWHGAQLLGVVLLCFEGLSLWSNWRFRHRARRVLSEVVTLIRYSKHISYYLSYELNGERRIAEYYGPGLIALFKPGERLEILIDPDNPPDTKIPEGAHVRWSRAGNCIPADSRLLGFSDLALIGAGIFLIAL